ncbi:MAG: AI-2E family transporter [Gammaproteobacteria bacterium]
MEQISEWVKKQLANPQVVFLTIALVVLFVIIIYAGNMLAPVLAGIVIAYLLEGVIKRLMLLKLPRTLCVWLVFLGFMLFLVLIVFGLLPTLYTQLTQVVAQIPSMLTKGQDALMTLPLRYPDLFSPEQVQEIIGSLRNDMTAFGQTVVTSSLSGAASIITLLIYVILLPILIFFFLKDNKRIIEWFHDLLPSDNQLAIQVWRDVDRQIGNYIRGKFWEILIVWFASFITFSLLGLQFSMLLAVLVGISVLIPYLGAAVVTVPVVVIAYFQWGWTGDFATLVIAYLVIQALDGNLLVPLLFSEVVNIHPVAIIVAVLFFGGLFGVWGVFFAIPLATLVQAIMVAWPKTHAAEES